MSDQSTSSSTTSASSSVPSTSLSSTSSVSSSSSLPSSSSSSSSSAISTTISNPSTTTTALPTTTTTTAPSTTTSRPTTATTTSNGAVTSTSTKFVSDTRSVGPTSTSSSSSGSKSFFDNTGAVAGVFSVVGLIALALLIALITNGLRRRRAKKFDRELAEATREAAAAPAPIFLDEEEDDRYGRGGYGAGSGGGQGLDRGFSDVSSHGTYAQPAMSAGSHEAYGMREMAYGPVGGHGVGVGEVYDPYGNAAGAGAAGAAGIGVARARSMRSDGGYAAGLQEGTTPYAAFAAPAMPPMPPGGQADPFGRAGSGTTGNNHMAKLDLLETVGMGAHVAGAGSLARGQTQYNSQYQPPYGQQQNLHQRSPSQPPQGPEYDAQGQPRSHSPPRADSYSSHYSGATTAAAGAGAYQAIGDPAQYPNYPGPHPGQAQYAQGQGQGQGAQRQYAGHNSAGSNASAGSRYSGGDEDAYGGYEETSASGVGLSYSGPSAHTTSDDGPPGYGSGPAQPAPREKESWKRHSELPNPFDKNSSHGHGDDGRDSGEEPRRVLKVANE